MLIWSKGWEYNHHLDKGISYMSSIMGNRNFLKPLVYIPR